jgi:hypothetical protein
MPSLCRGRAAFNGPDGGRGKVRRRWWCAAEGRPVFSSGIITCSIGCRPRLFCYFTLDVIHKWIVDVKLGPYLDRNEMNIHVYVKETLRPGGGFLSRPDALVPCATPAFSTQSGKT